MSAIITLCLKDGIVMAADSRSTFTGVRHDGTKVIKYTDGERKVFRFGNRNIGILWCGNAMVGSEAVPDYLKSLSERLPENATIREIAERISSECKERVTGEGIKCHIAGYENGLQCLYEVSADTVRQRNLTPDSCEPAICILWDGQRGVSERIIRNSEKLNLGDRIVDESDVPGFSTDEGVMFVEAMLKKSCQEYDTCGEPIFSLVISKDGLKWIHE